MKIAMKIAGKMAHPQEAQKASIAHTAGKADLCKTAIEDARARPHAYGPSPPPGISVTGYPGARLIKRGEDIALRGMTKQMNADTKLTFAAICGAVLAPARRGDEADAPFAAASGRATALIYASCADMLGERVEAGEAVSSALARWIAEAEAALTAYRGARADFLLIERRAALAAPRAALAEIRARSGAQAPEAQALAAAPGPCGPISRLVAQCALSQSPRAQDLDAELAACALAVTPDDSDAAPGPTLPAAPDLDALTAEIRAAAHAPGAHAALQAEAARLRDMLDHARRRARADATRLAEQARKIEAQHSAIRSLERDLGEAQGAARQVQKWLQSAAPT